MRALLIALLMSFAIVAPSFAVEPGEMLKDPVQEARAREISKELRCLVCQNESIDDSHADLAHDLRMLVRARIEAGDTNQQVLDYIVARYGQFVLLKPRFEPATYLLWLAPFAVIVIGGAALYLVTRRRKMTVAPQPLDPDEQNRVAQILDEEGKA